MEEGKVHSRLQKPPINTIWWQYLHKSYKKGHKSLDVYSDNISCLDSYMQPNPDNFAEFTGVL